MSDLQRLKLPVRPDTSLLLRKIKQIMPENNKLSQEAKRIVEAQTVALSSADELFVVNAIAESRQKIEAKEFDAALQIIATVYDAGSTLDRVPLDGLKADCFLGLGNFCLLYTSDAADE